MCVLKKYCYSNITVLCCIHSLSTSTINQLFLLVLLLLGFIPVCTLGLSQVGRINLGQNVSSLRYFAICGLQEGFEPFAINMKRDITMWFSKSLPQFVPVPTDHNHIEVYKYHLVEFKGINKVSEHFYCSHVTCRSLVWMEP